ncbi:MAG: hypothetical protein JW712_10655 [Dehalococcoidales bacterium]|nr:hypothetical protein [Dehalococcoidales bacterium]
MKKFHFIYLGILILVIAGGVTAIVLSGQQLDDTKQELESALEEIQKLNARVDTLQSDVDFSDETILELTGEVADSKDRIYELTGEVAELVLEKQELEDELLAARSELSGVQQELVNVSSQLNRKSTEVISLQQEINELSDELVVTKETLEGLGVTVAASDENYDAELVDNSDAVNPTWDELVEFLENDHTEMKSYVVDLRDCSQFSRDLHNNAEESGIRAATVHIYFEDQEVGHALNAFNTVDYGIVYVDCTHAPDKIARIKQSLKYRAVHIDMVDIESINKNGFWNGLSSYYYIEADNGGQATVKDITIFW